MQKEQKGFTLLEAVFAILLFALLVYMLMNFFLQMYTNAKYNKKQAVLMDQARTVNTYIKEKIREADEVKIYLKDGAMRGAITITPDRLVIKPILKKESVPAPEPPSDLSDPTKLAYSEAVSGELSKIECTIAPATDPYIIELVATSPSDDKKGEFTLNYKKDSSSTPIPISNMIKKITVRREADSNEIVFECEYQAKVPENNKREYIKDVFTETLEYKK